MVQIRACSQDLKPHLNLFHMCKHSLHSPLKSSDGTVSHSLELFHLFGRIYLWVWPLVRPRKFQCLWWVEKRPSWKWIVQVVQEWSFAWIETLSWFKSLLVQIPFCVVIGWPMGTHMDLNFELYETASLFITVLVVAFMLKVRTHSNMYLSTYIFCYVYIVYLCLPPKVISNKRECFGRVSCKSWTWSL